MVEAEESFESALPLDTGTVVNGLRKDRLGKGKKSLPRLLATLDSAYEMTERFDLGPYVHWKGNAAAPMHRWFKYREAYSPELIDKLQLGNRILDPFSGCGSIPIGSAFKGRKSLGIDLNPIAAFSTAVKLSPLDKNQLRAVAQFVATLPERIAAHDPAPLPGLSIASKVFEPAILDLVLRSKAAIEGDFAGDTPARDFLHLGWLAVLEAVGSYFKEGNGIKYRNKKRHPGRYEQRPEGEWQQQRFGSDQRAFFFNALGRQLEMMLADTACWSTGRWKDQSAKRGSAFDIDRIRGGREFDSVIFSPPYANRFDYFESFKVELWFGGFVDSYESLNTLRKASLRSHLNADFKRPTFEFAELEDLISMMDRDASSWRMGVADLLRGYFYDMHTVLRQCRNAAPNGKCYVVVGNSAFAGVIIPTDVLTATVGLQAGFRNAKLLNTRHLTVAPQQRVRLAGLESFMRESVVVLQ